MIEALVLRTGLHDGQGHNGVVSCTAMGEINIDTCHHSEVPLSNTLKVKELTFLRPNWFSANELAKGQDRDKLFK